LLELGIFLINDINLSLSSHDLAVSGTLLYGCSNFHDTSFLFFVENNSDSLRLAVNPMVLKAIAIVLANPM